MDQGNGFRQRILIAEDEALVALDEEALVQGLGYHVVGPVGHVDDAMRLVCTGQVDGAVLDVHAGGNRTFLPVAAECENRRIPFVFVTADLGNVTAHFPNAPVVRKPFNRQALESAIHTMMAKD